MQLRAAANISSLLVPVLRDHHLCPLQDVCVLIWQSNDNILSKIVNGPVLIETNVQYAARYRQTDSNKNSFTDGETAAGAAAGAEVVVVADADAGVITVSAHITH